MSRIRPGAQLDSLGANQVNNGQTLTFSKEKGVVRGMTVVHRIPLSDLGGLTGGSRVWFTWVKDN